jgi:hypothetical protein
VIKTLTVFIILGSMTLHCACRLGVLDHLYRNKNAIAHALGIIKEIPIAMCSSDYHGVQSLQINTHDQTDSSLPLVIKTIEIKLFMNSENPITNPVKVLLRQNLVTYQHDLYDLVFAGSVFRPPSLKSSILLLA